MEYDLQVHSDDVDRLRAELGHVVEFFGRLGYERCDVCFGWAWQVDAERSGLLMKDVQLPLLDLDAEVRKLEAAEQGRFGGDDVYVSFEGLELKIQFCHHRGTHVFYAEADDITRHFLQRWSDGGLDPKEFEKEEGESAWRPKPGEGG